jgi:hypothetical protein
LYINRNVTISQDIDVLKAGTYRFSMLAAAKKNATGAELGVYLVSDEEEITITQFDGTVTTLQRIVATFEIPSPGTWRLELRNVDTDVAGKCNLMDDIELYQLEGDLCGGEVEITEGATFELNSKANYGDTHFVLNGGTVWNVGADLSYGAEAISFLRLKNDSNFFVTNSVGFIGRTTGTGVVPSQSYVDLGGHKLTVSIAWAKYLYLNSAILSNGAVEIIHGGYFEVQNPTDARTVDFTVNGGLSIQKSLDVRDYNAVWNSSATTYNKGTADLNVHGTFRPSVSHNFFYGCTMQNGSVIDLSGRTGSFRAKSNFTSGSSELRFAAGATVTINLAGRNDLYKIANSDSPYVLTWSANPSNDVKFVPDSETSSKNFTLEYDEIGVKIVSNPGLAIRIR